MLKHQESSNDSVWDRKLSQTARCIKQQALHDIIALEKHTKYKCIFFQHATGKKLRKSSKVENLLLEFI